MVICCRFSGSMYFPFDISNNFQSAIPYSFALFDVITAILSALLLQGDLSPVTSAVFLISVLRTSVDALLV